MELAGTRVREQAASLGGAAAVAGAAARHAVLKFRATLINCPPAALVEVHQNRGVVRKAEPARQEEPDGGPPRNGTNLD